MYVKCNSGLMESCTMGKIIDKGRKQGDLVDVEVTLRYDSRRLVIEINYNFQLS